MTKTAVPDLFRLDGLSAKAPKGLAELPSDVWENGQDIPLDRWVLGQFNRLLPAKVNSRAMIRLFLENPKGLEIAETASTIANEASAFGTYLREIDAQNEAGRDDALATAFPGVGEDAEKGRIRYANQFVVYQNSKGELSGLMIDLKLINVIQVRRQRRIVPTKVAWEFAMLNNPVLDGKAAPDAEKFTSEEQAFLLQHVSTSVPVEAFAYRIILQTVIDGHTSPEQIDTALRTYLNEARAESLSQSFLASQRSGAISRMSDLGLIERKREGVRVNYAATPAGVAFVAKNSRTKRGK